MPWYHLHDIILIQITVNIKLIKIPDGEDQGKDITKMTNLNIFF